MSNQLLRFVNRIPLFELTVISSLILFPFILLQIGTAPAMITEVTHDESGIVNNLERGSDGFILYSSLSDSEQKSVSKTINTVNTSDGTVLLNEEIIVNGSSWDGNSNEIIHGTLEQKKVTVVKDQQLYTITYESSVDYVMKIILLNVGLIVSIVTVGIIQRKKFNEKYVDRYNTFGEMMFLIVIFVLAVNIISYILISTDGYGIYQFLMGR